MGPHCIFICLSLLLSPCARASATAAAIGRAPAALGGGPGRGSGARPPARGAGKTYSGSPCQETPCFLPGYPGFLHFAGFYHGKPWVPTPQIGRNPGAPGLGFLWKVSCGRAPTVGIRFRDVDARALQSFAGAAGRTPRRLLSPESPCRPGRACVAVDVEKAVRRGVAGEAERELACEAPQS